MEDTSEQAVTEAHARAIAPFRQSDGSYRVRATFRCGVVAAACRLMPSVMIE
jgi:hypothetical protein